MSIDVITLTASKNYTDKQIEKASIKGADLSRYVQTVNGIAPDENGNVQIPDSGGNANCLLTVETITVGGGTTEPENVAVTGLSLDLTSYSATVGGSFYINPVVAPSNATNKAVTWKSSATNIATVDGNGYVECIAEGSAVITCTTVEGGFTATCAVSVAAAEGGGGDEPGGDDTGGDTIVYFKDSPYTLTTGSLLKSDGTAWDTSGVAYLAIPYVEGIKIATCMNPNWNTATYPHFLVLENGVYTPVVGEATGEQVVYSAKQFVATFTGYGDDTIIYANINKCESMQEDTSASSIVDTTTFYYYIIPGGEA